MSGSASFRCFSPWWALTHLHLKKHSKTHRWQVLCSFVGAEIRSAKESPSTILAVWSRGPPVWANFCPSKPRLPSFIGGKKQVGQPLPGNLGSKNDLKEDPVMFLDWMLAGSFVLDLVALHWLCVQVFADPPCGTASGSYRPQCAAPYPPLIYPPTAEPLPVNFFSIKSIVVLICPPTAEPLPPLPPARHQAGGAFCPSMKFSHAFYENHSFYVCRLLWYAKTISEGFRYISLRVP